jgi:hypothetical protein
MQLHTSTMLLFCVLATLGHCQFLRPQFSGEKSVATSFSGTWSWFPKYGSHIDKQIQSTEVAHGANGMTVKETKIACHDGKCKEIEEVFLQPRVQSQQSKSFVSRMKELYSLYWRIDAMTRSQAQNETPVRVDKNSYLAPVGSAVAGVSERSVQPQGSFAQGKFNRMGALFWFLGVQLGAALLLAMVLIARKCLKKPGQAVASARERPLRALAEPLTSSDQAISVDAQAQADPERNVVQDAGRVKAVVSMLLPRVYENAAAKAAVPTYLSRMYENAEAKTAISVYLPRVYARALA